MNALKELIAKLWQHWKQLEDIEYWWVWENGWSEKITECIFDKNSIEMMKKYLEDKFFNYDSWYWSQQLYWEIVLNDGTWLERGEYDWSERREYKKCPGRKLSKDEVRIKEIDEQVDKLLKERAELYKNFNS